MTLLRAVLKHGDVYQILDERHKVVGGAYGETLATQFASAPELLEALKLLRGAVLFEQAPATCRKVDDLIARFTGDPS